MSKCSMRGLCLVVAVSLIPSALANPIDIQAYMTIGPDQVVGNQSWSGGGGTTTNATKPSPLQLEGPTIQHILTSTGAFANENHPIDTTFDMRLYFAPSSTPDAQSQQPYPYVEVTGKFTGSVHQDSAGDIGADFQITPTSAVLKNDLPSSNIPMSLLDQYLKPASYRGVGKVTGGTADQESMTIDIDSSSCCSPCPIHPVHAPEPATWLVFLAAIGVGVLRHRHPRR